MPRQFALLLCSLFVFYLLKYDRRQSNRVSWALWLPTLWMLCIATRSIDVWLGVGGGDRVSGGVVDPLFQASLLCVGLTILAKRNLNWSAVMRDNAWLMMLIGYMLVSVFWSDISFISFKRWIREITAVTMAFLVVTDPSPQQAMQSVLRRTVYVLIPFSVLLVKYYPDLGVIYGRWTGEIQWIGITLQKNGLGRLCVISVFFLVWTLTRRRQGRDSAVGKYQTFIEVIVLGMALWLLRGPSMWAASATALYALGLGLATFFGLQWMKTRLRLRPGTWVTIIACVIAFGIITPFVGGSTVTGFTSAVGRNATLTGRTDIWASLLPDVMRQPLFGYGFGSFWTMSSIVKHDIGEAHNGYLEVCLGLGFVGLILTALFLLATTKKAALLLAHDYDWGSLSLCFLLMAVVHNITESSLDSFTSHLTTIILFLSVCIPNLTKRKYTFEDISILQSSGSREIPVFTMGTTTLRVKELGLEPRRAVQISPFFGPCGYPYLNRQ